MTATEQDKPSEEVPNWGRYNYPLACRVLKDTDAPILYPAMKKSAKNLKGYIGWAKDAPEWKIETVQKFVSQNDSLKFIIFSHSFISCF